MYCSKSKTCGNVPYECGNCIHNADREARDNYTPKGTGIYVGKSDADAERYLNEVG